MITCKGKKLRSQPSISFLADLKGEGRLVFGQKILYIFKVSHYLVCERGKKLLQFLVHYFLIGTEQLEQSLVDISNCINMSLPSYLKSTSSRGNHKFHIPLQILSISQLMYMLSTLSFTALDFHICLDTLLFSFTYVLFHFNSIPTPFILISKR